MYSSKSTTSKKESIPCKTLTESYQLVYKKYTDENWSEPVSISKTYFNEILKPGISNANYGTQLGIFLKRAKQSGVALDGDTMNHTETKYLFDYTLKSVKDINRVAEIFNSTEDLKNVGNIFLSDIRTGKPFNYITRLNEIYNGNFVYEPLVIDVIKPAMAKTAARGMPGAGEAFFAFFFGGKRPKKAGDIDINNILIELKKSGKTSGGRVGKDLKHSEGGPLREIYEMGRNSKINIEAFNYYVQKYDLKTNRDFLFGKGEWSGVTGVTNKTQYSGGFLNQEISIAKEFSSRQDFANLIGAIHLIDYITKIQKFDYLVVFDTNNQICGFDISTAGKDPYELSRRLVTAGFYFKFKAFEKGTPSMFDGAGMQIFLRE